VPGFAGLQLVVDLATRGRCAIAAGTWGLELQGGELLPRRPSGRCPHQQRRVEGIKSEAEDHIRWTTDFYETTDMKKLQRMVDRNPKWSSFDDQVVDDCMMSANQGSKK